MRNYLKEINITGAVLVYREGNQCHWSLDWLYANCDRVCIVLDNWNKETEEIVMEYKAKYPEITHIAYSNVPFDEKRNKIAGQIKKRFKSNQAQIREFVIKEIKKLHDEKPIDMLIWPDSDEIFVNEFPSYLEEFWTKDPHSYMMLGFVEPYDNFKIIIQQPMAPHPRVWKYNPDMTVYPWKGRCRYHPYYSERPWKLRNVILHLCHFTEEYRKKRAFFEHSKEEDLLNRNLWILPKDVRQMTTQEIADYQPGPHRAPSKYPSILLKDYLKKHD